MMNCKFCKADCVRSGEDRELEKRSCYQPMTNGDRIRSKNNGELAELIVNIIELELRSGMIRSGVDLTETKIKAIKQRWFNALCDWLKQPCEVDHDTD